MAVQTYVFRTMSLQINFGLNIPCRYLDFISVMTYDFNGAWDTQTGVNSPLYFRVDEIGGVFDGSDRATLNLV